MAADNPEQSLTAAKSSLDRFLNYRPRSAYEVAAKMKKNGFSEQVISQTVAYLKTTGQINDQQFARLWTESRLKKPFGIRRIRMELQHKGIDPDIIASILDDAEQNHPQCAAAVDLAKKRLSYYQGLDAVTRRRRLYQYLVRRGFSASAAVNALAAVYGAQGRSEKAFCQDDHEE